MDRLCSFEELRAALDWHVDRVLDAQQSLRQMFLMPNVLTQGEGDIHLSLNNNTKLLVQSVFESSARFERVQRRIKGVLGQLETTAAEDRLVASKLEVARTQVSRMFRDDLDPINGASKAIEQLNTLENEYPGRSDIPATIGWLYKKMKKFTDAREAFRRASELQCRDAQMFWHWSDMEARQEEWKEAMRVAQIGRKCASSEPSLLYCLGYAQSRLGCELTSNGQHESAKPLLKKAEQNLQAFLESTRAGGYLQQCRAHRALVLNADALSDGKAVAMYLKLWAEFAPSDPSLNREYSRMRVRFPENVPPIEDGLNAR
jgi:tetratricopeptide (TPR) repeat protein